VIPLVKLTKRQLTLEQLAFLESEMRKNEKNKDAAWGLWAGLSFFGAHRFYTEDYGYATAMLLTTIIPLIGLIILLFNDAFNSLFYICLAFVIGSVIWSWIDAFFLNSRVAKINDEIEQNIITSIQVEQ
jgi:TM2 domain-containing membrane protein YozV